MIRVVVERTFPEPLVGEELQAFQARLDRCRALHKVRWVRSYLSVDRRRSVCEYEAIDVATVRNLQYEAGAQFDHVWAADVLEE